jgi:hypothetical protein
LAFRWKSMSIYMGSRWELSYLAGSYSWVTAFWKSGSNEIPVYNGANNLAATLAVLIKDMFVFSRR